ncbi:probable chitinase 10 [Drosophila obscura]|uniref:probable chitinase 10 n=1 Tax=Drosophila obscura TaxID=7282 RepID=UPI001BB20DEF|nr:probable chitinase 10 [Drosophila obscura]
MRGLYIVVTFGLLAFLAGHAIALPLDDGATESTAEEPTTLDSTASESTTLDPSTETEPQEIDTTTLPAPVLCEEGEEFRAAPNCQQYYQCLYGEGILKLCPPDLYWDPELNVCGWDSQYCENIDGPAGTQSPSSDCSSGLPFLPYEPDCSKYIQCVYNIGVKQNCPIGLFWNQPLQSCDYTCDSSFAYPEDYQEQ